MRLEIDREMQKLKNQRFLEANPQFQGRIRDVEVTVNFLRGVLLGRQWYVALEALGYAMLKHQGQKRSDGQPYIIHPLSMATHAMGMSNDPNVTEELIAILLLHDVIEDTGRDLKELPFGPVIRRGVEYMSFIPYEGESKYEMKRRKFGVLPDCKEAVISKEFDRYDNLKTMATSGFLIDKIRKNVVETDQLAQPAFKRGEERWVQASNLIRTLRMHIRDINDNLAKAYKVKLMDMNYVNPPDAKDYTYLLTGEAPLEVQSTKLKTTA